MKKLKKIYIEITNQCNLACVFCPKTKRKPEFMTMDMFRKIVEQIRPFTDYIYFHVKGEPLLHKEISTFLDISYEKGLQVNITTNGTRIQEVQDQIMHKPALRQMNFSLHSFDGNQGITDKDQYIDHILFFVKKAIKYTDMIISLRLWNLEKDNGVHNERKANRDILQRIEEEFDLPYRIQEKMIPGRGIKISDRVYLNQDYEFQWPDLQIKEESRTGFCYGLRHQAAILVDGTVVPCCLDGEGIIQLGNIHKTPFSEIIEGKRARNLYEGFSRREAVEELCRKCGYRKRFDD
ncbi:MAG: radical SAM protein [Epulopiscium sp.]|nr:radical SAM protein [Candidatus Epulonipiscium sp.]